MNVRCPSCRTVYRIDPAKVPDAGVRARCATCAATIDVRRDGAAARAAAVEAARPTEPSMPAPVVAPPARPPAPRVPVEAPPPPPRAPRLSQPFAGPRAPVEGVRAGAAAPPPPPAPAAPPAPPTPPPVVRPSAPVFRPTPGAPVTAPPAMPARPAAPPARPLAAASAAPAPPAAPAPAPRAPTGTTGARPVNPFLQQDPKQKARRLARALVSDMIVYQPAKRQRALAAGTLKEEFDEEIQKSWEEYVEQVGEEMATSTPYWREALNEILAGGKVVF